MDSNELSESVADCGRVLRNAVLDWLNTLDPVTREQMCDKLRTADNERPLFKIIDNGLAA